jgi:Domain of unknown function (DUF397)
MEESVGIRWRKSSYSGNGGGNCVEIATSLQNIVLVRDSKDLEGPRLTLDGQAWSEFIQGVKLGEFGL